ncbi:IMPACT family protein [Microlunatus speluncae]|uniref:IMPACT family protein n=1 Tax=Microlunatus speluncae TaxID=2594267 RepID=UPI0012666EE2|nr:YigZ family protein [Microlunatus speluncae]
MVERYRTVAGPGRATIEIKNSVFACRVARVEDEAAARDVIAAARREHHDAGHHCSAFVLGPQAELTRSSDDGEPSGTAGAPILQVLLGAGLTDVVAVVTRWFGGTLLGAGGLVRAYTAAARAGLDDAGILVRERRQLVEISVPASLAGRLENAVRHAGADVREVHWADPVIISAAVRDPDGLARTVAEHTAGAATMIIIGQAWTDT